MQKTALALWVLVGASPLMAADFEAVFCEQLAQRELACTPLGNERYSVQTPTGPAEIYVGNIRRSYDRDGDREAVADFIDHLLAALGGELPSWSDAAPYLFPLLESSDVELGADTLTRPQSDRTRIVLAYHAPGSGSVRFIRGADVEAWGQSQDAAWVRAQQALDHLAAEVDVEVLDAGGLRLGVLKAAEPYKASLLRAKALRSRVEPQLGWPVLAVAPDRDFVYLLAKSSYDELGRIGAVVQREYREAAYPVSTEVWELSDSGIEAIGEFPVE